jgi:hypothetical protein
MKNLLLKNWTTWRITRMVLSILFIVVGSFRADYILLAGGIFLFIHAILNVCEACAANECEIPKKVNNE